MLILHMCYLLFYRAQNFVESELNKFVTTAVSEQMPEWVRIMTNELKGYMQIEAGYYLTYMDAILEQG